LAKVYGRCLFNLKVGYLLLNKKLIRRFLFMSDQLTKDIQEAVDKVFKQKEEAEMRKEVEEALIASAKTIDELTTSLESKDEEISGFGAKLEALNETIEELTETVKELEEGKANLEKEKEKLENEKSEIVERAENAEKELDDMKKDLLIQARFEELKQAGVAATSNEEEQLSKIRDMSDEEFSVYKEERVTLRESIIAELDKSDEAASEEEVNTEVSEEEQENSSEEEETLEETEEGTTEVVEEEEAAAESEESIDPMRAMAAALNMEITPDADMLSRYRKLGEQMATNVSRSKDD
jgi:chromosome segregation ATPase